MEDPEKRLWRAGRLDLGVLKGAGNQNLAQADESLENFTFNGRKQISATEKCTGV